MREGRTLAQTPGRPVWFNWIGLFYCMLPMGNSVCHGKPAAWLDTTGDLGGNTQGGAIGSERTCKA